MRGDRFFGREMGSIEKGKCHMKAFSQDLREHILQGARTREALQEALEYALTTVSPSDAFGWCRHCNHLRGEPEAVQSS